MFGRKRHGVVYCRGCEVLQLRDESDEEVGTAQRFGSREAPSGVGNLRKLHVQLDSGQFHQDIEAGAQDVYKSFNILMRRKPKENNFKAILETIRDLMNARAAVPPWLRDVFLGYGDPAAARATRRAGTLNFNDTFLTFEHLRRSFPDATVETPGVSDPSSLRPPFRITYPKVLHIAS